MSINKIWFGRVSHYWCMRTDWWLWLPRVKWHRQGAAWCLDLQWLCCYTSTYWNDR